MIITDEKPPLPPKGDDLPPSYEEILAQLTIFDPQASQGPAGAGPSSPPIRAPTYRSHAHASSRHHAGSDKSLPHAPHAHAPEAKSHHAPEDKYQTMAHPFPSSAGPTFHRVPSGPSQNSGPRVLSPPTSPTSPVASPYLALPTPSGQPSSSSEQLGRTPSQVSLFTAFSAGSSSGKPPPLTKTQLDIRAKVLQLLQLLITYHTDSSNPNNVRASFGIIKGASSACQAYGLNFSALLALRFIGEHSAVYWATVKRAKNGQFEGDEEDPLLRSLYSFCDRPMDPGLVKELRRGCVAHSDHTTWYRYLASTEVTEAERTLLSLDIHVTPNDVLIVEGLTQGHGARVANLNETPDVLESFSVAVTFDQFLTRMKSLQRAEVSFIAHQRLWKLILRDDNAVEIELGEDSPSVFVHATLTVFASDSTAMVVRAQKQGFHPHPPSREPLYRHQPSSALHLASPGSLDPGSVRSRTRSFNDQATPSSFSPAPQFTPLSPSPYIPIPSLSYSPERSPLRPAYELTLRSPTHNNPLLPPPSTYAQPTGKAAWKDADITVQDMIKDLEKALKKSNSSSGPDAANKNKAEGGGVTANGAVGAQDAGGEVPVLVKATKKGKADREKGRVFSVGTKPFTPDEDGKLRVRLKVRFVRPEKESACIIC